MCEEEGNVGKSLKSEEHSGVERPAIMLLHGPNLNMLGRRDPGQYGSFTLKDIEHSLRMQADALGYDLYCFQSNHEGYIIDKIHETMDFCAGMLLNAGALTHYSYALRDAIELCPVPVMEIHISDIQKREDFRRVSVIKDVCSGQISGLGRDSYRIGLEQLVNLLTQKGQTNND
ncbi:MAG: type II 3-dehydroquinate dehydratase [Clostridiaceae bacterium]|nr:type II 3-dehydroquinate dehydratase [Clostridiaceae bacterium]